MTTALHHTGNFKLLISSCIRSSDSEFDSTMPYELSYTRGQIHDSIQMFMQVYYILKMNFEMRFETHLSHVSYLSLAWFEDGELKIQTNHTMQYDLRGLKAFDPTQFEKHDWQKEGF